MKDNAIKRAKMQREQKEIAKTSGGPDLTDQQIKDWKTLIYTRQKSNKDKVMDQIVQKEQIQSKIKEIETAQDRQNADFILTQLYLDEEEARQKKKEQLQHFKEIWSV